MTLEGTSVTDEYAETWNCAQMEASGHTRGLLPYQYTQKTTLLTKAYIGDLVFI